MKRKAVNKNSLWGDASLAASDSKANAPNQLPVVLENALYFPFIRLTCDFFVMPSLE